MVLNQSLLIFNVGDSRIISSSNKGEDSEELSRDHKPGNV